MGVLRSKKVWMAVGSVIVALGVAWLGRALGMEEKLTAQVVIWVLGLGGLSIGAHGASDIVSMVMGIQKRDGNK